MGRDCEVGLCCVGVMGISVSLIKECKFFRGPAQQLAPRYLVISKEESCKMRITKTVVALGCCS